MLSVSAAKQAEMDLRMKRARAQEYYHIIRKADNAFLNYMGDGWTSHRAYAYRGLLHQAKAMAKVLTDQVIIKKDKQDA